MKKSPLKIAQEQRQTAEHQLAAVRATVEATALQRTRTLLEAPQPVPVPWSDYPQFDGFSNWPSGSDRPYIFSNVDDRTGERFRPYYENDFDLRRMRAQGRLFKAYFPVAEAALESLTNYVISTGYEYRMNPKDKTDPFATQLAKEIQETLDQFLDCNDLVGDLDRQIHADSRSEGEVFAALYPDPECGQVGIDLIDPDYILQPSNPRDLERWLRCGHKLNYWFLGVHTQFCQKRKRDDAAHPFGYHAVFDKTGEEYDYLPAIRVQHIKRNVGRNGRRGVSDFLVIASDLEAEAKLRRNTAVGAAILAAIVMIRQHAEGTTRSTVDSMVQASATSSYQKPLGDGSTRTTYRQDVQPGTVKDAPAGMTHTLGALGTLRSPVYVEVDQFILRTIWQRWNAPEYMSGDASNANYASTLVAESPFVKGREADQYTYSRHLRKLCIKALRFYHEFGAFGRGLSWKQVCALVDLTVDYSSPASRDRLQQAQCNQIMHDAGVMSKETWQIDAGLDPDEENRLLELEPPAPAPLPSPFGMPGQSVFGGQPKPTPRLEQLAANALKRLTESLIHEADEKWITINGNHVQINDDGEILSGPMKGETLAKSVGSTKGGGGTERGASAVFQGEKFRVISPRAKLNIDQAADLLKERGYTLGKPESDPNAKQTLYSLTKGGKKLLVPAATIQKFLATEHDDISKLK